MPHNNKNQSSQLKIHHIERLLDVGYWHYNFETEILYWSPKTYELYGLSPDVYVPDIETAIEGYHPDDIPTVRTCVEKAYETGQSFNMQARLIHGDGNIRYVLSSGECQKNENGIVIAIFGVIQDITQHVEQQMRFEESAINAAISFWEWDLQSNCIIWLNTPKTLKKLYSTSLPENAEDFFNNFVHQSDELKIKMAIDKNINFGTEINETCKIHANSQTKPSWVLMRANAERNSQGQAIKISGSFTGIDDLKKIEDKLRHSNEDLERFASVAAHDLQQPLRSISSFVEIIKENYSESMDEKGHEYMDIVINSAKNMSLLINDLLEYSRLTHTEIKKTNTDINKIIKNILLVHQSTIESSNAKVTCEEIPEISCDPIKIERVLSNLIENALRYKKSDISPEIAISSQKFENTWVISVKDNGIGIAKQHQKKIFDMFERLRTNQEHTGTGTGTGIGLSICKKIVELHGGRIWVSSEEDKGSTFNIEIPA